MPRFSVEYEDRIIRYRLLTVQAETEQEAIDEAYNEADGEVYITQVEEVSEDE